MTPDPWGVEKEVWVCMFMLLVVRGRVLNKGSWSRSCCIPIYSRRWTGPPPHPCLYDQLCAGLPRFPLWWKIAQTCWTLPLGGSLVENLVLCSSAGHSQCCCDWSSLGIPPDGSWTDLQRPLMQQTEKMLFFSHVTYSVMHLIKYTFLSKHTLF